MKMTVLRGPSYLPSNIDDGCIREGPQSTIRFFAAPGRMEFLRAKKYQCRYFGSHFLSMNLDSPATLSCQVDGTSEILYPMKWALTTSSMPSSKPPPLSILILSRTSFEYILKLLVTSRVGGPAREWRL